jgi:hypothetical protein
MQALSFKGGSGLVGAKQILLRAGVAALLNASFHEVVHGGVVGPGGVIYYPYTSAEIIAMVNTALCSGDRMLILQLAYELDGYNNGIEYINWDDPTQPPPYP